MIRLVRIDWGVLKESWELVVPHVSNRSAVTVTRGFAPFIGISEETFWKCKYLNNQISLVIHGTTVC